MIRILYVAALMAILLVAGTAPARAQAQGTLRADCTVLGQPGRLELAYEIYNSFGLTWGPGANPDITGVIRDGNVTTYWQGGLITATGVYTLTGDSLFLQAIPPGGYYSDHFIVEMIFTGGAGLILRYQEYGGQRIDTPCTITSL